MPAKTVELEHVWQLRARKSVSSNLGDVLGAVQVAVWRVSGRASRVRSRRDGQTTGKDDTTLSGSGDDAGRKFMLTIRQVDMHIFCARYA